MLCCVALKCFNKLSYTIMCCACCVMVSLDVLCGDPLCYAMCCVVFRCDLLSRVELIVLYCVVCLVLC